MVFVGGTDISWWKCVLCLDRFSQGEILKYLIEIHDGLDGPNGDRNSDVGVLNVQEIEKERVWNYVFIPLFIKNLCVMFRGPFMALKSWNENYAWNFLSQFMLGNYTKKM